MLENVNKLQGVEACLHFSVKKNVISGTPALLINLTNWLK